MGRNTALTTGALLLGLFLSGCGPTYWPVLYQIERPLMFPPDRSRDAWGAALNLSWGESINSPPSDFTNVTASAGYCLASSSRILCLRSSVLAYAGEIGREGYGGLATIHEPSINLPIGQWLSLSVVSEVGGSLEFGTYVDRHFNNSPLFVPTVGFGGGLTLHFSRHSHLVVDGRLLPGSVRIAYLTSSWGVHFSILRGGAASTGLSYLLGEEKPRQR